MGWTDLLLSIATLVMGGGWVFTYRAYKREADGRATQSEAEGWAKMQEVYQKHIEDISEITDKVREERDIEIERNEKLRHEYDEMRAKYNELENQILDLRKELNRQGRKLEVILPFTCSVAGCSNRTRVELQEQDGFSKIDS